jgi:predicted anti-sigma-YlaC factor YlaD
MQMNCEKMELWMMEALDATLSAPEQQRFTAHLDRCAHCQAEWRALNAVERMLTNPRMAYPAPGFVARVEARLERYEAQRRTLLGGLILLGAAAVFSLVAALLLLNGRNPIEVYGNFLWDTYQLLGYVARLGTSLLAALWYALEALSSAVDVSLSNLMAYAVAIALAAIAWWRSMTSRRVSIRGMRNGH